MTDNYNFTAGQYLSIEAPRNMVIPMSIASAPARLPEIELHYRATPGMAESMAMDNLLTQTHLIVSEASGSVVLDTPDRAVLIIIGGSAAAQAFSVCEDRASRNVDQPTQIFWAADTQDDIYGAETLSQYQHVAVELCIDSRRNKDNKALNWLRMNAKNYMHWQVMLAGSPGFVYAASDILIENGLLQANLHSDIFAYAPRA
ncbi:MAG: hypothetical protein HN856_01150 [Gammaproteobacteria bacterium]|nr:hypothetical protein [Gammaproteobacteria bacterium]MCH1551808.1 hypothetical protein [Pseudomonadales bacterium]